MSPRYKKKQKGRLEFDSDLPKASIEPNGAFMFRVEKLEPGDYLIGIQLRQASCRAPGILVGPEKPKASISVAHIPPNPTFPLKINVGTDRVILMRQ